MRWPFRRRETEPATPSIDASPVVSAPASAAPAEPPAWTSLPPLQRTMDRGAPLTAPPDGVLGDVVARWAPATVLAPLGHDAGGIGPTGTIGLTGAAIETVGSGPELVGRPAPRTTSIQRLPSGPAWPSFPAPEAPTVAPAVLPPAPAPHQAQVVERTVVSGPVAMQRSLTSAADPVGPTLPPDWPPALVQEHQDAQPHVLSKAIGAETPHGSAEQAPVQRNALDAGQATSMPPRRVGLGAPLPGGLPVQRASPATLHERPKRVPVQRRSLDDLPVARTPARITPEPDALAGKEDSDTRTSGEGTAPAAVDTTPAAVLTGSIDVSRLAADGPTGPDPVRVLIRPLAGRLEPTVVQRSVRDTVDPDARGASAEPLPGHDPIVPPVQRSASALLPERGTPVTRLEHLPTGTVGLPPEAALTVARSVAANRLPPSGPIARSMTEPPAGHQVPAIVPIQRAARDEAVAPLVSWAPPVRAEPPPLTLAGRRPDTQAPSVSDVQRTSEPSQVAHAPAAAPSMPVASDAAVGPASALDTDAGPDIAIQRASDDTAGSAPTPAATSIPGGGPIAGASDKDLDELARRLYERIRRRLSRELLADRERAGLLTDLR